MTTCFFRPLVVGSKEAMHDSYLLPGVMASSGETPTLFSWSAADFFKCQDRVLADVFLLVFATEEVCLYQFFVHEACL